jgi:hypothetical protein
MNVERDRLLQKFQRDQLRRIACMAIADDCVTAGPADEVVYTPVLALWRLPLPGPPRAR